MKHVVYLDAKAKEFDKLEKGTKTYVIRGAMGRKFPYGKVLKGEELYFIENNGEGKIKAKGVVKSVINSDKMSKEQSTELVSKYLGKGLLDLSDAQVKRWTGKRYIVLVEVEQFEQITPFDLDRSNYGNMDDWLPFEELKDITK